jgi:hypothetical protein
MDSTVTAPAPVRLPSWREVVLPKEHGSWSLALEPVALGLLAAPTLGGAALAVAATAGFFVRRPLRLALSDSRPERRDAARRAAVACAAVAVAAWFGALVVGGIGWLPWLIPAAAAGAVFLYFDLQKAGREQHAEVAGAFAFAWLPAAFACLAGWNHPEAAALGVVMIARAVPTVLTVRGCVRARKNRSGPAGWPVVAAVLAAGAVIWLARVGLAPWTAAALLLILATRSFGLLVFPRPAFRASTIGMIEAAFGVAFVVAVAVAWRV